MRSTYRFAVIIAALAFCAGCGGPTGTAIPTDTAIPPAPRPAAATATPISSPTVTVSPTAVQTATSTLPLTGTPAVTLTPSLTPTPALVCEVSPEGGFQTVWQSDPLLQIVLGCPTSDHPRITPQAWIVSTAYQPFERGLMIWSNQIGWFPHPVIYVAYDDGNYQRFDDDFDPGVDPTSGGETPPAGLVEPILGFGKIWREGAGVRDRLGWATASEGSGTGRFQLFAGGDMIWLSQTDKTYVFVFSTATAHVFDVPF